MNRRDELADRYFAIIEKMIDKTDCNHCGVKLTVGDHPSCCSDCWEENAKYYEQKIKTKNRDA